MTPKAEGFTFPAEWQPHRATWLSFPWNEDTWKNRLQKIYPSYFKFIEEISKVEQVCISVANTEVKKMVKSQLIERGLHYNDISLFDFPTNDSWCRDHGPSFVINSKSKEKAVVNWGYNAWGGKYPPFDDDNAIPTKIARLKKLRLFEPNIIMEGGSIEVNGNGTLMTSTSCLLNKNRNPHLRKKDIEQMLLDFYGMEQILWLEEGIVGDDTDGHIDDTTRFINENTVLTAMEADRLDDNYTILQSNHNLLKKMRLWTGEKLNIVELPMPKPIYEEKLRLPASYANFYICNEKVIVPTYQCSQDETALKIIASCFPKRKVVGIDSTDIIWGLGSFHCLSQQEPLL
jgi:agmatine deiminase